ncbi:MAG TPA: hypothetical protein VGJ84_19675 [Polyangiaceae bacterium]|jgi:hypothetical protein
MLIAAGAAFSCRAESGSLVRLSLGRNREIELEFSPKSALAEYVELPGAGTELTLTLASYELDCGRFVPPNADTQASVTVVVIAPPGANLGPGEYAWAGHAAHGGTPGRPDRPYAVPTARVGRRGFLITPGGSLQLSEVSLVKQGRISGVLGFESAGEGGREPSSIRGSFRARLCRYQPSRKP